MGMCRRTKVTHYNYVCMYCASNRIYHVLKHIRIDRHGLYYFLWYQNELLDTSLQFNLFCDENARPKFTHAAYDLTCLKNVPLLFVASYWSN